jgi:hypothetical protein
MTARRPESPSTFIAISAIALIVVAVLFLDVIDPPTDGTCNTSLLPSTFQMTLVPAHLLAAAVLCGCLWALGASGIALGAVGAVAFAGVVVPGVFGVLGLVAVVAASTLGSIAVVALLIRLAITARKVHDPAERRAANALNARVTIWLALLFLLPTNLAIAYMRGADLWCF